MDRMGTCREGMIARGRFSSSLSLSWRPWLDKASWESSDSEDEAETIEKEPTDTSSQSSEMSRPAAITSISWLEAEWEMKMDDNVLRIQQAMPRARWGMGTCYKYK